MALNPCPRVWERRSSMVWYWDIRARGRLSQTSSTSWYITWPVLPCGYEVYMSVYVQMLGAGPMSSLICIINLNAKAYVIRIYVFKFGGPK